MSLAAQPDLPVLAPPAQPLDRTGGALAADWRTALAEMQLPAQAAAVAAGGFILGAVVARLTRRRRARTLARMRTGGRRSLLRPLRSRKEPARTASVLEIVASRSLLVDVHLLAGRD